MGDIEINNKELLDRVVEVLLDETSIEYLEDEKSYKIYSPWISDTVHKYVTRYYFENRINRLPDDVFMEYVNKHFGVGDYGQYLTESTYVWLRYVNRVLMLLDTMEYKYLDESYNPKNKTYLDKVLEYIIDDTEIEPYSKWSSKWIKISVPFTHLEYSRIMHFDREDFFDYCRDAYGLTKDESYSVWEDYINEINQILKNDWGISDPIYH